MTQKEKELLLKDLSARLTYGTKVRAFIGEKSENDEILGCVHIFNFYTHNCKPYLRPMSSMTEEERKEYLSFFSIIKDEEQGYRPILCGKNTYKSIDWLNAHHFDYRGLIPKGLALEAPENMYK